MSDGAGLSAEYVELQLRFARRAAALGTHDFEGAVSQLTNLHRRLGFGDPTDTPHDQWMLYLGGLEAQRNLADQVRWTIECAASTSEPPQASTSLPRAGPFSIHVHGDVVRTHFVPTVPDEVSPLHSSRLQQRRKELRAALADAVRRYPAIRRVRGTSWLYSTKSYCSIFPLSHIASATERTNAHQFQGSSAWGQFLDHHGRVKEELASRFIAAVDTFDGSAPWRLFPIPTLIVDSPIETFDLYEEDPHGPRTQ